MAKKTSGTRPAPAKVSRAVGSMLRKLNMPSATVKITPRRKGR